MLYESAARADEGLCLNIEDLYPQDKRGKITAKGGATVDSLDVRHRPVAAPTHCTPHPRLAVPHRSQSPGRNADAGRVPGGLSGPALLPPG